MSEAANASSPLNIYEEVLNEETICDCSSQGLAITPKLDQKMLSVSTFGARNFPYGFQYFFSLFFLFLGSLFTKQ